MASEAIHRTRIQPVLGKSFTLTNLRALMIALGILLYSLLGYSRTQPPISLDVSMLSILVLSVWWAWKVHKRQGLARSPISLPLIAYLAAVTLSTFFSVDMRRSLDGVLGTLGVILFYFLICDLLLNKWEPETFVKVILIYASLLIVLGIWETASWYWDWFSIRVPEYPTFLTSYRTKGVGDHPNFLAMFIYIALPFVILRLAKGRSTTDRIFWLVWIFLADAVLFFTGSRGGFFGTLMVVGTTAGWLLFKDGIPRWHEAARWLWGKRNIWIPVGAFIGLYFVIGWCVPNTRLSSTSFADKIGDAGIRITIWKIAWNNFLAHPLTGSGPINYSLAYISSKDAIGLLDAVPQHAHNFVLNTLSQLGLAGMLALIWILITIASIFWTMWLLISGKLQLPEGKVYLMVGSGAALIGVLVHSMVDVLTWIPHAAILILILFALGFYGSGRLKQGSGKLARWSYVILLAPLILLIPVIRFNQAYTALMEAMQYSLHNNWGAAASAMDQAILLDPSLTFYSEQQAYTYGNLVEPFVGTGDPAFIQKAIQDYSVVLRIQPFWIPNLLNEAYLMGQVGDAEDASQLLEKIPESYLNVWPLAGLMLAKDYVYQGRYQAAMDLYVLILRKNPESQDWAICRESQTCQDVALEISWPKNQADLVHEQAMLLLQQDRPEQALNLLLTIPSQDSPAVIWLDRADAHLSLGQIPQANFALQVAKTKGANNDPFLSSHLALTYSKLHQQQGKTDEAIDILEEYSLPKVQSIQYQILANRRVGLVGVLLPGLWRLEKTEGDVQLYQKLSALYAEQGRFEEAAYSKEEADKVLALLNNQTDR